MSTYYKLRIPEPCREDWNKMTPKDQGRFCSSCSKTVVDFTVMDENEIQKFLKSNQGTKLCGHARKSQLDRICTKVPVQVLQRQWLSHRAFLLALLLVMGTTMLSCKDDLGNHQKIDEVTVVDSLNITEDVGITGGFGASPKDPKTCNVRHAKSISYEKFISDDVTMGMIEPPPPPPSHLVGEVVAIKGIVDNDNSNTVSYYFPDEKPKFPDTPKNLNEREANSYFNERMTSHFKEHFKTDIAQLENGKYRVVIGFTITKTGTIKDIKVRAPQDIYEEEAKRVLKLLPVIIPAKHGGKPVNTMYALPIIFQID